MEEFRVNVILAGAKLVAAESKAALRLYFEPLAWCLSARHWKAKAPKREILTSRIPAHACEPPMPREAPYFQKVIAVSAHGNPEELQLCGEIEKFIAAFGEDIRVQPVGIRDADFYLIVTIGVGVATNLITDLIKYLAKRLREMSDPKRKPVIYISPVYAPKRIFRLPEEEEEAQEHFRRHPSLDPSDIVAREKTHSLQHVYKLSDRRSYRSSVGLQRSAPRERIAAKWSRYISTPLLGLLSRILVRLSSRDR